MGFIGASTGARVKRALTIVSVGALLLAAWPAFPQQDSQDRYGRRGEQMGNPAGQPQGQLPARQAGKAGPRPPMQRMTPEDRRLLRQDVQQHGRELYRGRRGQEKR
ncbi:MAG: hypothetical protein A2W72_17610 [Burkholderiales bacterium RIFCSPLOWO2_12_67_14]|nr:MAG: hypothetical protein A2W72_17610 [Burkholderiales bacterium RIFCSPLOWO2_12_67_14]